MDCVVNVTTKSAQHAHTRMIAIIVEKSPLRPLRHGGSHFVMAASMT